VSAAGGRSYLLPQAPAPEDLRKAFADAGVRPTLDVVEGRTDGWIHVLHRVKSGRDVFFIANQNLDGGPRKLALDVAASGFAECWDPWRNEISSVPQEARGAGASLVRLTLEPLESVLLVFAPTRRDLPARIDAAATAPRSTLTLVRDPTPPLPKPPPLAGDAGPSERLKGCSWVWYPEGSDPTASAPPGKRFFRKEVEVPAGRAVSRATFYGTADNSFVLLVDGAEAGRGDASAEGWRNPVEIDLAPRLGAGSHQLAIEATNATDRPSPAGLIGKLVVEFSTGEPLVVAVDGTWKVSKEAGGAWASAAFDDSTWPAAKEIARFGGAPWGTLAGGSFTVGPVEADPFWGHVDVPADTDLARGRAFLEMDALAPEEAARVTVNGTHAGGFIGRPLRLDVTRFLKAGRNEVRIEPFAPNAARIALFDR
jgi:hypothetical protein